MNGSSGNCTLKLQGLLQGRLVHILVDSGSTHNFISQNLVKTLALKPNPCSPFNIVVANGDSIRCNSTVEPVKWSMADQQFEVNMHVIPLGGYDMILGVHWMTMVSPVTFDYTQGSITVHHSGNKIRLDQPPHVPRVHTCLHTTELKYHKEEASFLV